MTDNFKEGDIVVRLGCELGVISEVPIDGDHVLVVYFYDTDHGYEVVNEYTHVDGVLHASPADGKRFRKTVSDVHEFTESVLDRSYVRAEVTGS